MVVVVTVPLGVVATTSYEEEKTVYEKVVVVYGCNAFAESPDLGSARAAT